MGGWPAQKPAGWHGMPVSIDDIAKQMLALLPDDGTPVLNRVMQLDRIVELLHSVIKDQLKKTRKSYDYILFDCAPGISALTEVSLRLADLVVVPTIPDFLSTYGLHSFCSNLWTGEIAKRTTLKKPKRPLVLITRKRPTREHARTAARLRSEAASQHSGF